MSEVDVWILLGNKLVLVSARFDDSLIRFFRGRRNDVDVTERLPAKHSYGDCRFYQLKKPVSIVTPVSKGEGMDYNELEGQDAAMDFINQVKQACMEETNRAVSVHPITTKVRWLAKKFSGDDVCLVIEFPDPSGESNKAIVNLRENHPTLLEFQQATVETLGSWCPDDVQRNLQGGILTDNDDDLPQFGEIQETLAKRRLYEADDAQKHEYENASIYETHFKFDRIFAPRETKEHIVQPPFSKNNNDNSRGFEYYQERSWGFPIFVDTRLARNVWQKFTPGSDWVVDSPGHRILFVISEVISQAQQSGRSRMLVQATALSCAGQFLLQSASKLAFFIVTVYVDASIVASRYIVMQTGCGNTEHPNSLYHDKAVYIHRKDFKLTENKEEVDFLREMYNLATQTTALSGDLDRLNGHDEADRPEDKDDLSVFEAEDIQNVLHRMNYKIEFTPWGHPQLAVIVNKAGDKHGHLKFVEREREVSVLQYLTEIEPPSNHTISDVQFWPVQEGIAISMPAAGGRLTSLDHPGEQLWSVALQLFEAVTFMHEHNVAHMDLKPQNVIIPSEGGHLSIIDFSVSIRVHGPEVKYTEVIGTEDYIYMAPEVHEEQYTPILADLWSCGRTLEELCSCCGSLTNCTTLLEIARRFMDRGPEVHSKMSAVLKWTAPAHRGKDNVATTLPRNPG